MPEDYRIRDNQFWYSECTFAQQIDHKRFITIGITGVGEERTLRLVHSEPGTDGSITTSFKLADDPDKQWWKEWWRDHLHQVVQIELLAVDGQPVKPEGPKQPSPSEPIPGLDIKIIKILQEMPDFFVNRQQNFIWTGFDSAWTGGNPGAIAWMTGSSNELVFNGPKEATFKDCIQFIDSKPLQCDMHLLMIDQPTIVKNYEGFRPVESAVAHEMGRAGSAAQPASRNNKAMFGKDAPIWSFLSQLKERDFQEVTAKSLNAKQGRYYLETYPAFGNLGLFGYKKCPKYNPDRETFSISDWKMLCRHTGRVGAELKIEGLKRWAERMCRDADNDKTLRQWKKDQDFLDAVLCMLFGYIWWLSGIKHSVIIGDNKTGYMVVPCLREGLRTTLRNDAKGHAVPVDELFPRELTSGSDEDGASNIPGKRTDEIKKNGVAQGLHIDWECSNVIGGNKTGDIVGAGLPGDSQETLKNDQKGNNVPDVELSSTENISSDDDDGAKPQENEGERKGGFIAWLIRILQKFQDRK